MKRAASLLLALSVALSVAAGCGKKSSTTPQPAVENTAEPAGSVEPATTAEPATPAARPTPSDAELDALFARTLEFLSQFADAVAQNEKDCKKMAAAMTAVFDANAALLAEAKAYEGNEEVDAKADAYMKAHEAQLEASMGKMMPGMQACSGDTDVQAAMERFDAM